MMTATIRITPVILCGGKGTRLWPLSRSAHPKQFLSLLGGASLFQQTLGRVADPERYDPPIIVTNADYRFLAAEQALEAGVQPQAIMLEPMARNTAPAIAAATAFAARDGNAATILVLPSDHQIIDADAFQRAVETAAGAAQAGRLVTFGINPTEPATGFGYVEAGEALADGVCEVRRFVEKPPLADAEHMLAQGGFFWNAGMFAFRTDTFLSQCRRHAPEVAQAAEAAVAAARADLDFLRLDPDAFAAAPDISIDYAIFEKTDQAAIVPCQLGWSDLGAWDSVWKSGDKDAAGNVLRGPVSAVATTSSLVIADEVHVAVNGVEDLVVISTRDAVYVGRLSDAQSVGEMVRTLAEDERTTGLTQSHLTNYRPWGGYTSVLSGDRFQVKRLFVKPGKTLSLQKHQHRAEHWVVVQGTAEVTVGETVLQLAENESIYVPRGEVHRLANPGKILLEIIEVQTGSYLGEDDIIRLEDVYGRS